MEFVFPTSTKNVIFHAFNDNLTLVSHIIVFVQFPKINILIVCDKQIANTLLGQDRFFPF